MAVKDTRQRGAGPSSGAVQTIERAVAVVRAVAASGHEGCRLTDLAPRLQLSKSTAHRILLALTHAGLIEQDPVSKRFFPGVDLFLLGTASAPRFSIVEIARPALARLAADVGDTVFLTVPVDNDWVCVERQVGPFPIRTLTVDVGDRGPLGVGSGGLALLAAHSDEEVDGYIEANVERLAPYRSFDAAGLRRLVATTRRQRHAYIDRLLVEGMSAIGVAICDAQDRPVAALSIAAISSRLEPARRKDVLKKIHAEVTQIQAKVAALGAARPATMHGGGWERSV